MISQERLAAHIFGYADGFFVVNRTDIQFLQVHANASFLNALLLPLTFDALGASLRSGHRNILPHLLYVDFDLCKKTYRSAEADARTWFRQLDLQFEVDGIDVVDLDAPSQFLLFRQATHIESLATRIVRANPAIETFHILSSADPLPLDFYFDSDTAAGVLRFVCEREGRACQTIVVDNRYYKFPKYSPRPFFGRSVRSAVSAQTAVLNRPSYRVGLSTGGIRDHELIAGELTHLRLPPLLFASSWDMLAPANTLPAEPAIELCSLVSEADVCAEAEHLPALWTTFQKRKHRSSLADALIRNPYLEFQFEYVITKRWRRIASLIRAAKRLVAKTPLDLFVCCELCHDEGAILARAYRAAGTRVLVAPHSGWPGDRSWNTWSPNDSAMTRTRTAARRMRELAPLSQIFVTGAPQSRGLDSPQQPASHVVSKKRELAAGRRILVLLTNALELLDVPFVAPAAHIDSLALFSQVPEALRSQLLVAVRTKPGVFAEDTILYAKLSSFTEESLSFLEGLSFSECLQLADCVVGMNVATSGYYEVLESGIPLLHLQLAEVTIAHPDLPRTEVPQIRRPEDVWPTIASVLFDGQHRGDLIEQQQRFIRADLTPNFPFEDNPLRTVLTRMARPASFKLILNRVRERCLNFLR